MLKEGGKELSRVTVRVKMFHAKFSIISLVYQLMLSDSLLGYSMGLGNFSVEMIHF